MTTDEFIKKLPNDIPITYKTRNEYIAKIKAWVIIFKAYTDKEDGDND